MTFVDRFTQVVVESVPSAVGIYLHGSAALGDFIARVSDVDVCVVVPNVALPEEFAALEERLSPSTFPVEGGGFDVDVVRESVIKGGDETPVRELGLARHGAGWRVSHGEADPNLWLIFEMCRRRGRAVRGPLPGDVFAPVPNSRLLDASASELRSWLSHDPILSWASAVLSACRARWLVERGALGSKSEAGRWAVTEGNMLAERALAARARRPDGADVADQVLVRAELEAALGEVQAAAAASRH